ncbi:MAG: SpoIID/LytB domain-containing protein [Vicinamibacterales bacterium]
MQLARPLLAALLALTTVPEQPLPLHATPASGRATTLPQPVAPIGASTVRIGVLRNGKYEVTTLPLEVYVARVLAGEAAPASPQASLEALAVAIRTYTVTNRGRHAAEGFDLCDQTHCQVMRASTEATERASTATAEQILLYQGAPATVFYSASCGGRSEKPSNVWPSADDPPYLSVHDDDGCGGFPMWSAELATSDLQRALRAGGYTGSLRDVRVLRRNESGRVARLALDGMSPAEISGQDLRMVVGRSLGFQHLQSTQFELRRNGNAFRFSGRGAGHGVGLCVIGSMKLAAAGQDAATILARYFPGTTIGTSGPRLTSVTPTAPAIGAPPPARVAAPAASSAPTIADPGVSHSREATTADVEAGDLQLVLPAADPGDRRAVLELVRRERASIAEVLGEPVRPVRVRVFETNEAFEHASGQPWFALGGVTGDEIQLAPLWLLRERGMLERIVRRQLVRLFVDRVLPARPSWIREGAAVHFGDAGDAMPYRPPCPSDAELQHPTSVGALGDALARARGCFERQVSGDRDWRKVR